MNKDTTKPVNKTTDNKTKVITKDINLEIINMADKSYDEGLSSGFATIGLHTGHGAENDNLSRAPAIHATTSFLFKSAEHGANLFAAKEFGNIYTRIMNPTTDVFETRVAALEGGVKALATASGMSAQLLALLNIAQSGDHIISAGNLYGGTFNQFKVTLPYMGIKVDFADANKPENFVENVKALIKPNTKAVHVESIANPTYNAPDYEALVALLKEHDLPLIVDNTFGMCGYTCRPIKWGANVVVESATKWIGGHGTTIGGVIIDGGNFNWGVKDAEGKSKFPLIAEPCPAYHGLNFWDVFGAFGKTADSPGVNIAFAIRARFVNLRDMGAAQNPFGSFLLIQGLETLQLRAQRHCDNANKVAAWLQEHPDVAWVNHGSLSTHPAHKLHTKYHRKGCYGGVLSFGLKGGEKAGAAFIDNVKLASHLANVGDAKTLVIHPRSTTHQQLSPEEMETAGIPVDMIRVSVGIEEYDDIQADFAQAIKAAVSG